MALSAPRYLDSGEAALAVEFGRAVEDAVMDRVLALDAALAAAAVPGIRETVPTYRSLMIHYDPLALTREALIARIEALERTPHAAHKAQRRWTVPVCYAGPHGEDLGAVAQMCGLSEDAVVARHTGGRYRAAMYGFAPGYCYLGGVPPELAVSRRTHPRPPTPENVVMLGGGLGLIATVSMPTGWWIIGRTPERLFAPERPQPFLIAVGDEIRFEAVDEPTFERLSGEAALRPVSRCEALA